jgi:hypothetical protein
MVTIYAGHLELEEATKIARDKLFGFNPAEADGMSFIAQGMFITAIEEGKRYIENFKPGTVVIANGDSELAYLPVMKKGYAACAYPPTKEGCASAWGMLSSPTSDIGVVIVDVTDGLTPPAEIILDATVNDHPATRRVFVGLVDSKLGDFNGYSPFTRYDTHQAAAGGLLRLLEGFNPEHKAEAVTGGPVKIQEGDTVKVYDNGLGRPTSMRRRFADE